MRTTIKELHAGKTEGHALEVVQVDLGVVPGDEALHLRRGEHVQPLGIDDAAEAPDEGGRLLLDLGVHAEVGHQVDVADPVGEKRGEEVGEERTGEEWRGEERRGEERKGKERVRDV